MSTTRKINNLLKKQGMRQRLVRGKDYYYVTDVCVSSSLYVFSLGNTQQDFDLAKSHIEEVLTNEFGSEFNLQGI